MITFQIRSEEKVYNKVEQPAAVFDKSTGALFGIGESRTMIEQYDHICNAYLANGMPEMTKSITYMDLPKDQEEIDKVFQITGYIKQLYERTQAVL